MDTIRKDKGGAEEMSQSVKSFLDTHDDLSLIPSTHIKAGYSSLPLKSQL